MAFATPTIEQRLKELAPGRGRLAAAASVDGAASVFALQPSLADATKQVGGSAVARCGLRVPCCSAAHGRQLALLRWRRRPAARVRACSAPLACSTRTHRPRLPHPRPHPQELAWASYALLRNTNTCGLAAFWDGKAVLARGLLGAAALGATTPAGGGKGGGDAAAAALAALSGGEPAAGSAGWRQGALYCPDRGAIDKAGAGAWACVPAGAESLLVQPLLPFGGEGGGSSRGVLLLVSERPRALSAKERAWAAAIAAKLHDALAA